MTSRAAPRRRAEPRRAAPRATSRPRRRAWAHGFGVLVWLLVVLAGAAALGASLVGGLVRDVSDVSDQGLGDAGALACTTAYAWGLAARIGGRPVVCSLLALLLGGVVLYVGTDPLRSGAAVVTAALTSVFAVMMTRPAVGFAGAVRETVVAALVSTVGAVATLAWAPVVDLERFQYTALTLSLVAVLLAVYRLGAGFHGLGTRGMLAVVGGGLMLVLTLGYAELLRRYGTHDVVTGLDEVVRWSRHRLGAFPRPMIALLGVPALAWGTHMRARRRQGWWVCAFGVAATCPVAYGLLDPSRSVREAALGAGYAAVIGLVIGFLLIRIDLALTGSRGRRGDGASGGRRGGRRARQAERAAAVRPEPGRTHALW